MATIDDASVNAAVSAAEAQVSGGEGGGEAPAAATPDVGAGQTVEPDKGQDPTPAEPVKAEPEPDEDPLVPSAADLEAINQDPRLLKVYKSMQRGLTAKTTKLATERKQYEESAQIVNWIKSNPQAAIREMAQRAGLSIAEAKAAVQQQVAQQEAKDDLTAEYERVLGPDVAALMRPLIEKTAEKIAESRVKPLEESTRGLSEAAAERGIIASLREFGATVQERGEDWDDGIQGEMAQVISNLEPAPNTSIDDFLATAHDVVVARRARQGAMKTQLARLKAAKEIGNEPSPKPGGKAAALPTDRVTADMSDGDAINRAVEIAYARLRK